ncbi:MAG: hypothetical protein HY610_01020 [Elusimicrobia bacterium]|nr:hypothetical protein [Elusimicrobiota bacterium]
MNLIHLMGEQENIPRIHEEFYGFFILAEDFWKRASTIMPAEENIFLGKSKHLNLCLAAIYSKQLKLYWSVYIHAFNGLGLEAQLPLRAMWQVLLNLLYLKRKKDHGEVAKQWLLWVYANSNKQLKGSIVQTKKGMTLADELEKSLSAEKAAMGEKEWKVFTKNGPSRIDLTSLSHMLGMSEGHNMLYPFISGVSHGYDLLSHVTYIDSNQISIKITPDATFVDIVLITAMSIMRDCLYIINELLGLGKDGKVNELTDLFSKARALKTNNPSDPLEEVFKK